MMKRVLPILSRSALSTQLRVPAASSQRYVSTVTFVKKIYADGSTCQKCDFVWKQIEKDKMVEKIDRIVVADERDQSSEGIVLARRHNVTRAPFFVVADSETPDDHTIYDVYFQLKKNVFNKETGENEKNEELIRGLLKQGI